MNKSELCIQPIIDRVRGGLPSDQAVQLAERYLSMYVRPHLSGDELDSHLHWTSPAMLTFAFKLTEQGHDVNDLLVGLGILGMILTASTSGPDDDEADRFTGRYANDPEEFDERALSEKETDEALKDWDGESMIHPDDRR